MNDPHTQSSATNQWGTMAYGDRIYDTVLKRYAVAGAFLPDGDVDVTWEDDGSPGQSKWYRCRPAPRMTSPLTDLIERVRTGEGADRELDGDIAEALGLAPVGYKRLARQYWCQHKYPFKSWEPSALTTSLDAVVALIGEKLPGTTEYWFSHTSDGNEADIDDKVYSHGCKSPARALLAAFLTALRDQESGT